jgi:hypothetical protein
MGCASEDRGTLAGDPLIGGGPARPAASGRAVAQAGNGTVPAMSAPSSSTSTAALAPGTFQPLDPSRDLHIGGNRDSTSPAPANARASGSGSEAWQGPGSANNVALNRPDLSGGSGAPTTRQEPHPLSSNGFALMGGSRIGNYEQAQALLKARGVTWYRLETWGDEGEVKFSCSIPNRQNPNIRRTYEARAHDELSVLRAVLDKIDADQR